MTYFGKLQNHEQKVEAILTTRNLKSKYILNKQECYILIINKPEAIYNIAWNLKINHNSVSGFTERYLVYNDWRYQFSHIYLLIFIPLVKLFQTSLKRYVHVSSKPNIVFNSLWESRHDSTGFGEMGVVGSYLCWSSWGDTVLLYSHHDFLPNHKAVENREIPNGGAKSHLRKESRMFHSSGKR